MKERLKVIVDDALDKVQESNKLNELNDIRIAFLGKKGELTNVLKSMKEVDPKDRPAVGQLVNKARASIEEQL